MTEILEQCHCENPALEKAKEKGLELVCLDCHRWRKRVKVFLGDPIVYPTIFEQAMRDGI